MEKKIIAIMVTLIVVAALVVAFVMIAAGGVRSAGGFTKLFDQLVLDQEEDHWLALALPDDWEVGDEHKVTDTIVDMTYQSRDVESTTVYVTTLWFTYMGDKWSDLEDGTLFYVPYNTDAIYVNHGLFHVSVSSATNISADYDIGDSITLYSQVVSTPDGLAFGDFEVEGVI